MTLDELRGKVLVHIEHTPRKCSFDPLPADEIKVSHVQLIVGACITYLGYSIGDDGHLVPPKRKRANARREGAKGR